MNKVKIGFAFLVCLALISCTININTGAKIDPEYALQMTLTAIADKYFNNEEYKEAIEYYSKFISLEPNSIYAYLYRGAAHEKKSLTQKDYLKAIHELEQELYKSA